MNPNYNFQGRVALVTGAASGMGRASAKAFAQAGAALVRVDRDREKLRAVAHEITTGGGKAIALTGDVSHEHFAETSVERAVAEFGRLDMAYNNAGILGPMCPLIEETGAGYDAV